MWIYYFRQCFQADDAEDVNEKVPATPKLSNNNETIQSGFHVKDQRRPTLHVRSNQPVLPFPGS